MTTTGWKIPSPSRILPAYCLSPSFRSLPPLLASGESITKEILNYIEYAKAKGCSMTGPEDPDILHLNVLA